ncbi:MAG: type restriction enzyme subunit [Euryarchaeota archaeon]|nr:type restriction enzyme subunit [Euryarchaeota archaeon]
MTSNLKNIPPNWQKVRFDEIAEIVTDRIEKPTESGLSDYIGLEHLDTDCIRIKRFGSTEDVDATKFLCKKGDIIFGKRRAYLRKLAVSDREAVVSAHSMVLRPTGNKIDPDFLPCFMQSSVFWKTAHSISEGSMSPTIKWKTLAAQEFWLPSIEEQKKISELLWSIEDNIEKTEKLIEIIDKLKQELLSELLTKGIKHTRFKDSELGRIPEEWEVVKLGKISNIRRGASPRPIDDLKYFAEDGPGWIRIADATSVYKYISETSQYLSEIGASKSVAVHQGDLIMSICATIGKPVIVNMDACIHDGFVLFSDIKNDYVTSDFLFYYLIKNEENFKSKKQVGTQGNLNTIIVKETKIAIPNTLEEQVNIVNVFEYVDNSISNYLKNLETLIALKKKLTNELISGRLGSQ